MINLFLKKWAFIFILIVSNFIIGMKTQIRFFYLFFWFLTSIAILSIIWVMIEYFVVRLEIKRKAANKIELDDILEVEAVLENKASFPIFNLLVEDNLSLADFKEKRQVLTEYVAAKSTIKLKYSFVCSQRGKYTLGPFIVYFFDPLGLFFLKKIYPVYCEAYVYPKAFKIQRFPSLVKGILPWFGIDTTRVSGSEDEFYGVREYKEGDPIKRIHWISTARKNRLIVKQFQRQSYFRATIIFNLEKDRNFGEGRERIAEYIINIAASVSKYLLEGDISLEIIAHTKELVHIPTNKGKEHLENLFKFFTIAQAESTISLREIFQEFSSNIPNDSTLIIIMLDRDWQYLSEILALQKKDVYIIPLILVSSTFLYPLEEQKQEVMKDVELKLTQKLNFNPILFSRGDNLEEIFHR